MAVERRDGPSIEKAVIARSSDPEYKWIPTSQEGVAIKVDANHEGLGITERMGARLVRAGIAYAKRSRRIKKLEGLQGKGPGAMLKAAADRRGFRGLVSNTDDIRLSTHPRREIAWDSEALKENIGPAAYDAVAGEELVVTIAVPKGHQTPEGPVTAERLDQAVRLGMVTLGLSEPEILQLVHTETRTSIDEPKLAGMIQKGQISLGDNVATVSESWQIRTQRATS